jgi:hypothetical protein
MLEALDGPHGMATEGCHAMISTRRPAGLLLSYFGLFDASQKFRSMLFDLALLKS